MLKNKLNTIANKELSIHSKIAIFISIISLFVFSIGVCQNISQDYLYSKILDCIPIAILLIVSAVINFFSKKRKLLSMMQFSLVIIEFIDLMFATGFSTMSHSYIKFFEMLFADYSAYMMTLIFLVDIFAVVVRYCSRFWYSLYAGLKVFLFASVLISMMFSEYILLYDIAFTASYLLYYIAMLVISFDN
ncbi:MAG: hypothetical protein J1E81_02550 [Eubacterium sp.]|nr:hypothetical protein [Eubacterium sp.]